METFAERLKRLRLEKHMKQCALSVRSGISPNQISNYERGICDPGAFALELLADTLGVTMDYLWRGKCEQKRYP